jgi:ABC-type branched-subunit amino acid transport system substrate-binding protein
MAARLGVALFLALLLVSCVQPSVIRGGKAIPRAEAVDADLRAAKVAFDAGRDDEVKKRLERFLQEFPDSRRSDEARFMLAEVYLRGGDAERAAQTWRQLVERTPLSRFAPEARLRAAKVYRDLGQPDAGRRMLAGVDLRRAPEALRGELQRTLADLSRASGDFPAAVVALSYGREYARDERARAEIDLELAELIQERLRDPELETILPRVAPGAVYARVALELARRRIDRGELQLALDLIGDLPATLDEPEARLRQNLAERVARGSQVDAYPIGLEVPLSGAYAPFGRSVLRGVSLALDLFSENPGRYRVVVRDTSGDPVQAEAATRQLIQEGVRGIIGPMRSVSSAAAAPIAAQSGIPMLSLAVRPDVPYLGSGIFRLGVTSQEQVSALVGFAMDALEAQRFAVLYPKDAYGIEYKNLFWEEVEKRGGRMVGIEGYDPASVDIQTEIKKLVGLHYVTPDEAARIEKRDRLTRRREQNRAELASPELADLPPYVDFDALFIPEAAAKVGVILPQLRFYDVADIALLGTSDWNDPKLVELAAQEAEDSVFVDSFSAGNEDPLVQEFVSAYYAAYGEPPDAYAAQGYEAAALVRGLVTRRASAPSSAELTDELRLFPQRLPEFRAVAGLRSFDAVGGSVRDLAILTVKRRQIRGYDRDPKVKNKGR